MSHAQRHETSARPSGAWAGWIAFAAVILILIDVLVLLALTARWDEARAAR